MSEILIFVWVLACIGSVVNKVTVAFSADINNDIFVGNRTSLVAVDHVFQFRNRLPKHIRLCRPRSKSA